MSNNSFSGSDSIGAKKFYEQTGRFDARDWENEKALSFISENEIIDSCRHSLGKCPICEEAERDFVFKKQGYNHWICKSCRLLYVDPCLKHEVILKQVYGETPYPFFDVVNSSQQVEFDSKRFVFALSEIKKLKLRGSILDIGCGSGLFLELAQQQGFKKVVGIEPLRVAREYAIKVRGLEVLNTSAEEFLIPEQFDVITLWELLDHVIQPNVVIKNVLKHLKPGGIVLFSVRNGHSLAARVLREKCNMFLGYAHLNFWNFNAIHFFLDKHNLKLRQLSNYISEVDPVNNYLNFEDPYKGSSQPVLRPIDADYVIKNNLGYKFICIAQG